MNRGVQDWECLGGKLEYTESDGGAKTEIDECQSWLRRTNLDGAALVSEAEQPN